MAIKLANNFKPNQGVKAATDPKNISRVEIPLTMLSKTTTSQFVNINLLNDIFVTTLAYQLTFKDGKISIDINLKAEYKFWTLNKFDQTRKLYGTGDGATVVEEIEKKKLALNPPIYAGNWDGQNVQ